jgi:glycosyltransferase involved in cell wall biosynthesis
MDAGRFSTQGGRLMNAVAQLQPVGAATERLRCLWIGRYIPHPMNEGAKVYSAQLAASLASAGCFVRVLGFGDASRAPRDGTMEWVSVPGARGADFSGVVNRLPLAAAVDATPAYRALLERQLREPGFDAQWDIIVFDSYASGWALERCAQYRRERGTSTATNMIFVHVSHNEEAAVWRSLAERMHGSSVRRWLVRRNAAKVAQLERSLIGNVDLFGAITDEDAESLRRIPRAARSITLMPGYEGPIAAPRTIAASTPRRVVIVGSFNWVVKRENLQRFVEHADPIFSQHGIELVVAGDVPQELQRTLQASCRATRLAGFVPELMPLLAEARIALVPELIGGGFKLKFLDYFFGRIPVASVDAAAAGLPDALRECLLRGDDIPSLTERVVQGIDDLDDLNRRQSAAFERAQSSFRWSDRGTRLLAQIRELRTARSRGHERKFGS